MQECVMEIAKTLGHIFEFDLDLIGKARKVALAFQKLKDTNLIY